MASGQLNEATRTDEHEGCVFGISKAALGVKEHSGVTKNNKEALQGYLLLPAWMGKCLPR